VENDVITAIPPAFGEKKWCSLVH